MRRDRGGFTLIELLISIALMVMILFAITLVFAKTTETVAIQEARTTVYTNARYALDIMENDLMGVLPFDPPPLPIPPAAGAAPPIQPVQAFWMENGYAVAGQLPTNVGGGHEKQSGDIMSFRATTTVADTLQTVQVTYMIIPGNKVLDSAGGMQSGDATHEKTARTERGLFTLIRQVRGPDKTDPRIYNQRCKVREKGSVSEVEVPDQELCHYLISFNLEYLANNLTFSQLDAPGPFPRTDPIGDGKGPNDVGLTALRMQAVRVTMVIVEDIGERQERTIQKVMWIPQG
ncbi:MAG TPA: prepilin-type N-terminal cleavage/methylation domain-containing protein [Planctomycetota bacterium]